MYGSEDLERFYFQYQTESLPSGESVQSFIREQLHREPNDGDFFIVMSKNRRIIRMFTYDNRSYSLFENEVYCRTSIHEGRVERV